MTQPVTSDLLETLQACERSVWSALVSGDQNADQHALHAGFLGVYSDGFASKADHVAQLEHGPTIAEYSLSDFQMRALGTGHALLSYKAEFLRTSAQVSETMYVSSIWQRAGEGWVNIFSQDTPST